MDPSDEGLVDIVIAFDPENMARNGTLDRVPAARATQMVNEGRARYPTEAERAAGAAIEPES